MAKGNGNTRNVGPSQAAGGRAQEPDRSAYLAAEGSEKYTYETDKVKFRVNKPLDVSDTPLTAVQLRHVSDYEFYDVERDEGDGKFHINDTRFIYNEPRTFAQAVKEAVTWHKERYQNNERTRDRMIQVRNYDDDSAPSAWVTAELVGNNKVKISITRFKP